MHKFILGTTSRLYTSISPVYPTTHLASTLLPWSRPSFALTPWIFCLRQLWPLPSFSMCAHHPSTTGDELSFSSWPFRLHLVRTGLVAWNGYVTRRNPVRQLSLRLSTYTTWYKWRCYRSYRLCRHQRTEGVSLHRTARIAGQCKHVADLSTQPLANTTEDRSRSPT